MKQRRKLLSIAVLLGVAGCDINFTTQYDRIEERTVRPLAFIYDNHGLPEAAPGDTVTYRMYFAGEPVHSIKLTATTSLVINSFGTDTFADTSSIDKYAIPGSYAAFFGGETDSASIRFVVPADIISSQFDEDATIGSLLPANIADSMLPEPLRAMKPSDIIRTIEALGSGFSGDSAELLSTLIPDSIAAALPAVLQALTVSMKLFATINDRYRVESTLTVRYNSRFAALLPDLPVNRAPRIDGANCYRIRSDRPFFDPAIDSNDIDTVFRLYPATDTIVIDTGFHYFFAADTSSASFDSGFSLTDPSHRRRPEEWQSEWFFQSDSAVGNTPPTSLMTLDNAFGGQSVELQPSLDTRLVNFNLWLVTRDNFLGEKLRPVGIDIRCIEGTFRYTDAYKKQHP